MQPPIYIKRQGTENTTTIQDYKVNTTGKPPNSYQNDAFINLVDRKFDKTTLPPQKDINTKKNKKSQHTPLESPYTCVCGKRWIFDKSNSNRAKEKLKPINIQNFNTLKRLIINNDDLTKP